MYLDAEQRERERIGSGEVIVLDGDVSSGSTNRAYQNQEGKTHGFHERSYLALQVAKKRRRVETGKILNRRQRCAVVRAGPGQGRNTHGASLNPATA